MGAVGGGLIGGGVNAAAAHKDLQPLKDKVRALEEKPDRGVGDALRLAGSKARLTMGEHAKAHPMAAASFGALTGGLTGAVEGPAVAKRLKAKGQVLKGHLKDFKEGVV